MVTNDRHDGCHTTQHRDIKQPREIMASSSRQQYIGMTITILTETAPENSIVVETGLLLETVPSWFFVGRENTMIILLDA